MASYYLTFSSKTGRGSVFFCYKADEKKAAPGGEGRERRWGRKPKFLPGGFLSAGAVPSGLGREV